MSGSLTIRLLMCLYPRAWRARYAEELEALIVASSGGGRVPWQIGLDVAVAGVHERLRAAGMSGVGEPEERVRGGSLVVLCAVDDVRRRRNGGAEGFGALAGAELQRLAETCRPAPSTHS